MTIQPAASKALPKIGDYPVNEASVMPSERHGFVRHVVYDLLLGLLPSTDWVAIDVSILSNPRNWRDSIIPDLAVSQGVGRLDPVFGVPRRQYRLWDEGKPPDLVFELSSTTTVHKDIAGKKDEYARLGVRECVLFDPLGEMLSPRLQVFRLQEDRGRYVPAGPDGGVPSIVLDAHWVQVGELLRLRDPATGVLIPSSFEAAELAQSRAEAERSRAEAERSRAEAERSRAEAERNRAEAAEVENAQLREELARLRDAARPPHQDD